MSSTSFPTAGRQKLSNDIFYYIVAEGHITSFKDIRSLSETSRSLTSVLRPMLYRQEIQYTMDCKEPYDSCDYNRPPHIKKKKRPGARAVELGKHLDPEDSEDDAHSEYDEPLHYAHGGRYPKRYSYREKYSYRARHKAHSERPTCYALRTSALHWAASNGFARMTEEVLKIALTSNPGYIDLKIGLSKTPLALAAQNGHVEVIQLLIDMGAFVDAPSSYSTTLTRKYRLTAPSRNFWEPAYLGQRRKLFCTPLSKAIIYGQENAAVLLAQHTEHLDNIDWSKKRPIVSPLTMAVKKKMTSVIKVLLSRGYKDAPFGVMAGKEFEREWEPLCYAAMEKDNNEEMIGLLLDYGMDIGVKGCWNWSPIEIAYHQDCINNARYLFSREDPTYAGDRITRLFYLGKKMDNDIEFSKMLCDRLNSQGCFEELGAIVEFNRTAWLSSQRTFEYIATILTTGLDRKYSRPGQTYLHWLFERKKNQNLDISGLLGVLFRTGKSMYFNALDAEGRTVLDCAYEYEVSGVEDKIRRFGGRRTSEPEDPQVSSACALLLASCTIRKKTAEP